MNIEIKGIGFPNKGAELMLLSIIQSLKAETGRHKFAIDMYSDYKPRISYGLYTTTVLYSSTLKNMYTSMVFSMISKNTRNRLGILMPGEIDVILDASGFAYGDDWGVQKLKDRLTSHLSTWKRQGKRLILLPQAFGPFKDRRFQQELLKLADAADCIFARDKVSYQHLVDITGERVNIRMAGDFTVTLKGIKPADSTLENRVCIIPNSKMRETSREDDGAGYINTMARITDFLLNAGLKPFFLIHEGINDKNLGDAIVSNINGDKSSIPFFQHDDPIVLKGVIASSQFVIGSRFHGLVSALSSGVPALACGWSHKYQELLNDFGCPEMIFSPKDDVTAIQALLNKLLEERESLGKQITAHARELQNATRSMWEDIADYLPGK